MLLIRLPFHRALSAFPWGTVCLSVGYSLPFSPTPQPSLALSAEPPAVSASPFANQAMGSMSDLPSTSGANVASTSAMPQRYSNTDFGPDINLWYQPSSDAVTRAGDVLGMPHLDGYTAKVGSISCACYTYCFACVTSHYITSMIIYYIMLYFIRLLYVILHHVHAIIILRTCINHGKHILSLYGMYMYCLCMWHLWTMHHDLCHQLWFLLFCMPVLRVS